MQMQMHNQLLQASGLVWLPGCNPSLFCCKSSYSSRYSYGYRRELITDNVCGVIATYLLINRAVSAGPFDDCDSYSMEKGNRETVTMDCTRVMQFPVLGKVVDFVLHTLVQFYLTITIRGVGPGMNSKLSLSGTNPCFSSRNKASMGTFKMR